MSRLAQYIDHHVKRQRHDGWCRCRLPQQRNHQGHAHEAAVGKGSNQRPEGGIAPAQASLSRAGRGQGDHCQGAAQINRHSRCIQQLCDRRRGAEAKQHAGQGKEQHEYIEPRNGVQWKHAVAGHPPPQQHQGKKGCRDGEDMLHGVGVRRAAVSAASRPQPSAQPAHRWNVRHWPLQCLAANAPECPAEWPPYGTC